VVESGSSLQVLSIHGFTNRKNSAELADGSVMPLRTVFVPRQAPRHD